MHRSRKRLLMLLAALPVLILVSALIYMWLMNEVEGDERTFLQAFEFAAEVYICGSVDATQAYLKEFHQ